MRKTLLVFLTLLLALSVHELPAASSRDKVYLLKKKQDEKCRLSMMRIYEHLKAYHAKKKAFPKLNNYSGLKELVKNGALPGDFVCDAYRGKKNKKLKDMTEKNNPFLYFGGINYAEAQRVCPNIPLLCDKPNSRHLNVLLADGNIISVDFKRMKRKISNCKDIVNLLNELYGYPADILDALRVKAGLMDKQLSGK